MESNELETLAKDILSQGNEVLENSSFLQETILGLKNDQNTFDTEEDYHAYQTHILNMRTLIEDEHKLKKSLRKVATYGAFGLVLYSILFITLLFGYLIIYKNYVPSSTVLVGISVTFVANIIGLVSIVFRYVFSSTRETADYIARINKK